jgi:NADH-quinone oxidoreductase subunit M
MICLLVLDAAMTGTFLATDIFLFYVFWEVMLIPMLLIIGVWGSQDRVYASLKFFLYTFAGSVLMLVAIFWLYRSYQHQFGVTSTNIKDYYRLVFDSAPILWGLNTQAFVFLAFTIAFAIKVPLFPLHTWLPDAHVQAPTGGSILLAAVLLKMGTYGILRFSIPICPQGFVQFTPLLVALSLAGIIYGAWVAFQQTDMKKLVAYSSVSHLGFVTLAICAVNTEALTGGMLQMINHGFSTGALFFIVGALYERRHSRSFADYGGIAEIVPWLSIFLVFVACSSMAVPGLNGFVGEFLILLGTFKRNPMWAAIAISGVVFGALYMLWMLKKVLFGGNVSAENKMLKDLDSREWVALVAMGIFIVWLGAAPNFLLKKIEVSMQEYWKHEGKIGMTDGAVEKTPKLARQKVSIYDSSH